MKKLKMIKAALMVGVLSFLSLAVTGPVYAAPEANVLKNVDGIEGLLVLAVRILIYGLGAAATVGVVIAGIMYLSARDNPQMVAKAKMRLIEIAIGLVAWSMLFALLQFLIPGFTGI